MSRIYAWTVTTVMIVAVMWPIAQNWREKPTDSFPLSFYPMFSRAYPEVERLTYVVGLNAQGERVLIHYRYAGSGGMNQVRKQLRKISKDKRMSRDLCKRVARRMRRRKSPPLSEVIEVRLVTGRYHRDDYFSAGKKDPISEKVHATCRVDRAE